MSPDDWKKRLGTVYSTDPNFKFEHSGEKDPETLPPAKQQLTVQHDNKQRKGKPVTLVLGFTGKQADLEQLAKFLKTKCGVGGSAKDGEIIIQGELKQKVFDILKQQGYNVKLK